VKSPFYFDFGGGELLFRKILPVTCLCISLLTLGGCPGSGSEGGGASTFEDMTAEEWADYNAEEERIAAENAKLMEGQ